MLQEVEYLDFSLVDETKDYYHEEESTDPEEDHNDKNPGRETRCVSMEDCHYGWNILIIS